MKICKVASINNDYYHLLDNDNKKYIAKTNKKIKVGDFVLVSLEENKELKTTASIKSVAEYKYYDVYIDILVPATQKFRILAASPEEASQKILRLKPERVDIHHNKARKLKLVVYETGTKLIKFIKNMGGL